VIRCGENHRLEMHIDTDEANSAGILTGDILTLQKENQNFEFKAATDICQIVDTDILCKKNYLKIGSERLQIRQPIIDNQLIMERDVDSFIDMGIREINCKYGCIITPLARDRARDKGLKINVAKKTPRGVD
jgi:hypothetical protein